VVDHAGIEVKAQEDGRVLLRVFNMEASASAILVPMDAADLAGQIAAAAAQASEQK
jgi:hypothetical protein